jgi:hypothetical protein
MIVNRNRCYLPRTVHDHESGPYAARGAGAGSEGKNLGTAKAAISQTAMTTQRNLTANAPIPPNMAWMRTAPA